MLELSRCVRFCINPAIPLAEMTDSSRHNTFAAWPAMQGLGAFYEIEVRCRGEADPTTGYLMNISVIDNAVRTAVIPLIHEAATTNSCEEPAALMPSILEGLQSRLGRFVSSVRWRLTPYYSITMTSSTTHVVTIAQQFEFAAAHRLHCNDLSPDENRAIFGRCNNPNAHGHNYRLEVAVDVRMSSGNGSFTLADLERIVNESILQHFDHKNLNVDVPEFAEINPSVENIARVCHELVAPNVAAAGAAIVHVTVWETDKTSCTYKV